MVLEIIFFCGELSCYRNLLYNTLTWCCFCLKKHVPPILSMVIQQSTAIYIALVFLHCGLWTNQLDEIGKSFVYYSLVLMGKA